MVDIKSYTKYGISISSEEKCRKILAIFLTWKNSRNFKNPTMAKYRKAPSEQTINKQLKNKGNDSNLRVFRGKVKKMAYLEENNTKPMAILIMWMIKNRRQLNDVSNVPK